MSKLYRLSQSIIYDPDKSLIEHLNRDLFLVLLVREKRILDVLVNSPQGNWVSIEKLLEAIYPVSEPTASISVIYNLISSLRKKLMQLAGAEKIIMNRSKLGYHINFTPIKRSLISKDELNRLVNMLDDLANQEINKDYKAGLQKSAGLLRLFTEETNPQEY
ncbi:MAG: DNA-binding winged helix-turn-helix (wHTH) protein [Alteromonadaceae bacterium]|jgi:DNA-binding winged helix-turn-helix (wHTH) protein